MKSKKGESTAGDTEVDCDSNMETATKAASMLETPAKPDLDVSVTKGKKLGIKRVKKKKAELNMSRGPRSASKNFSFLNMSVQKQTLRANNRALAKNLAQARQDIRNLHSETQSLRYKNQELNEELLRLKRLVGLKDEQIQNEVKLRMQEEMQRMDSLLDGLTQSMMQSTMVINDLKERTVMYSNRRSTDSVRTSSLGNAPQNEMRPPLTARPLLKEKGKEDLMKRYLSKADEMSAPPGGRLYDKKSANMDMSIVAEQSVFIDEDNTNLCGVQPLDAVAEVTSEITPQEQSGLSKQISKLPQRVLKTSLSSSSLILNQETPIEAPAVTSKTENNKKVEADAKIVKETNVKTVVTKESTKKKQLTTDDKKVKKTEDTAKTSSKDRKRKMEEDKKEEEIESKKKELDSNFLDADISAFGFSNILVSGSPIHVEKKKEETEKPKSTETVEPKSKDKTKTELSRRETFVKAPAAPQGNSTSSKLNKKATTQKSKPKFNTRPANDGIKDRRGTFVSENPFVPKSTKVVRTPTESVPSVTDEAFNNIDNPFKPSKTLLRSPVHGTSSVNASPEEPKLDSHAFLAKIKQSFDSKCPEKSSPLPEPMFPDEPTTYFNSEMEFTSVIDSSKLLQSLRSEKNNSTSETNSKKVPATVDQSKDAHGEDAAVEVRTKKPGVFTFSVARKEADGTRKPIPEPVRSKARSKKKKPATPEKEERKTGDDRDMFNFGDRTPTMPIEKLAKTKSVYDMSMNDTVVPSIDILKKRDKKDTKIPDPKPDEHIYYLPLKGCSDSPDEKQEKSSRSRSKSRKQDDDDDEDWVPGGKSTARSRSRGRKSDKHEDPPKRQGRSRSRRRAAEDEVPDDESQTDAEKEVEKPIASRGRSRSRKRVSDENVDNGDSEPEEEIKKPVARRGRSQSRKRVAADDELENDEAKEEPVQRRGRSRSRKRVIKDSNKDEDDDVEMKEKDETVKRRGRSRSRKPVADDTDDVDDDDDDEIKAVSKEKVTKRSKSRSRPAEKQEDITDVDDFIEDNKSTKSSKEILAAFQRESPILVERRKSTRERRPSAKSLQQAETESLSTDDLSNSEEPVEKPLTAKRPARSKSRSRRTIVIDESDGTGSEVNDPSEAGAEVKTKPRSLGRRQTFVKSAEEDRKAESDSKNLETDKNAVEKSEEIVSIEISNYDNDDIPTKPEISIDICKSGSKRKAVKPILVSDSDPSDSENILHEKVDKIKQRKRTKSRKITENEFSKDDLDSHDDKNSDGAKTDNDKGDVDHLKVDIGFVNNKRRAKSSRSHAGLGADVDDISDKASKDIDTAKTPMNKTSRQNISDSDFESPKAKPKSTRKASKSTKKTVKKKKTEDKDTPCEKKEESKTGNTMSTLEMLKRRLTMVGTKKQALEDTTNSTHSDTDDRNRTSDMSHHEDECGQTPDGNRPRRNRTAVCYVVKNINCKLRQGDPLMVTKAKAEQARLDLAKKMCGNKPRVSRDDQENVELS